VCIGARTIPASHGDRYPLIVLANILGGGVTSRLFQALRERTGLVYTVDSHVSFWREAGAVCSFFSVDSKNLERALDIFHAELRDLKKSGARENEIESAKAQIKGSLVFGAESVENRFFNLVQSEYYYGRYMQCAEIVKAIEKVSRASITEAVQQYLDDDRLTYTACGPVGLKGLAP
jgi:predicted Zn-dependent peptidase